MAEKHDKKAEDKAAPPSPSPASGGDKKGSGGLLKSTPMLLGVVMLIEAGVLFGAFKVLGGGPDSAAADLARPGEKVEGKVEKPDPKKSVEIEILKFKAPNKLTGRMYLYDVTIAVQVRTEAKESIAADIKARSATIQDRVRTIIAQADPDKLGGSEPGLETLRRQVKVQLDEILGPGLIEEVLIPQCIPYRAE